ncbi:MAG: IS3 family transposase, partial [Lysobacter sp.]|nr:IS3 family transposase [Lysobacter sp.]
GAGRRVGAVQTHVRRPGAGESGDEGPYRKKVVAPAAKRDAAGFLVQEHELSIVRACGCVGLSRSAYYRPPPHWTVRDAEIIGALAQLVEGRPNRGFWKCRKQLRRQGRRWNHKRIYRVYKRMNLHLRRPAKRRLPKRERLALYVPRQPDTVWSADFMSDALICGRRFRTFNVVDDFNRQALHIEVDTSITSERLIRIFERLRQDRGLPQVLRTDNGPEFLGEAFTQWAKAHGMAIQYIQPGKPNQNAYVERFNRTLRDEVLDQHLFARLDDVREAIYWWMIEYNEERPHDSLGDLTPIEYLSHHAGNSTLELSP